MKIAIVASMVFIEKMVEIKKILESKGHQVYYSAFTEPYLALPKDQIESQTIADKNNNDALIEFSRIIKDCDAVLALNYDKKGIFNYIGGNTFLELGYSFILGKKIYLLNPIPDMLYTSEIEAMKPIILNGDLNLINN